MKDRKFLYWLGAKILMICLVIAGVISLTLGVLLMAEAASCGASFRDLIKKVPYEQSKTFAGKVSDSTIPAMADAVSRDAFSVDGEYDESQTIDIMYLYQGVHYEDKNPATTYTLKDLAEMYSQNNQYSRLADILYADEGKDETESEINTVYNYGDILYLDAEGNLYCSSIYLSDQNIKELKEDNSDILYRVGLQDNHLFVSEVKISEVPQQKLTEITDNEFRARLFLEPDKSVLESHYQIDYSKYGITFVNLYRNGKQYETALPESGQTLADYALMHPDTVSLWDLYDNLLTAEKKASDLADHTQESSETSGVYGWYYFENTDGKVITNNADWSGMDYDALCRQLNESGTVYGGYRSDTGESAYVGESDTGSSSLAQNISAYMSDNGYSGNGIIAVRSDLLKSDSDLQQDRQEYLTCCKILPVSLIMMIAGGVTAVACFVISIIQAGRRDNSKTRYASAFAAKIPVEILVLMDIICIVIVSIILISVGNVIFNGVILNNNAAPFIISSAGILTGLILWEFLTFLCKCKSGNFLTNSIFRIIGRRLITFCRDMYRNRTAAGKLVVVYGLFGLVNLICICLIYYRNGVGIILFLIWIGVFLLMFKKSVQRQKVKEGIHEIAGGNLDYQIELEHMSGDELEMARDMNNVRVGMQNALQEQMKSERLKTDLITNVSHDIKTPLTSIINYVDILKREDIQDEKIRGYIDILDMKAKRLKHLTEDLVEASKISSGNISLNIENINLKQLLKQTNGEFTEKFEARDLQLICTLPENEMMIRADGRRMWRVIENLYNNAAKYAMAHTRVYVDGSLQGGKVTVSIKNISDSPLNFSAEELMQRFVRGDVSRSTEGSGLGLEIARNLTVMQKGSFDIYLDGDLFKVTISFDAI